ncbi:hypothetical protein BZA77DRAFT_177660 [Pyronema omphalodes]|nr:hypothetical protein BZA77DRAFT_177660 [Pyronema omphalodes]
MAARLDISSQILHRGADTIECWDDDPDFEELGPIEKPQTPPNSSRAGTAYSRRETPVSSRRSTITSAHDIEALETANREHQIPFDGAPATAIKSAINAGIPIPENVPPSALVGGTIKRLQSSSRSKKVTMDDDWGDDLELPTGNFTVKRQEFPASLQHLPTSRPTRNFEPSRLNSPNYDTEDRLNRYRDTSDDDSFFAEDSFLPSAPKAFQPSWSPPEVRMYTRNVSAPPNITQKMPNVATKRLPDDDFENDFEFPSDQPLQLGFNRQERRTLDAQETFEDWGDGDSGIGSSYTGMRTGMDYGHSIASPTMSAMESEDDMPLEGLVLPDGVLLDFEKALQRRRAEAPEPSDDGEEEFSIPQNFDDLSKDNEEFFEGIEIGDGEEVFDSRKLSLNRNVRQKEESRKPSPIRRTATSLTFTTNKQPIAPPPGRHTGLGRAHHPTLLPSAPLEPVAERDNQPQQPPKRNARNRWSAGPSSMDFSRYSNSPESSSPSSPQPSRRGPPTKPSRNLRENVPTTNPAQYLRAKRSIPNIADKPLPQKNVRPQSRTSNGRPSSRNSSGRPPSSGNPSVRPPSSGSPVVAVRPASSGSRPPNSNNNPSRPASRTSSGRPPSRTEASRPHNNISNIGVVRHPAPFLPGGASIRNSAHVAAKTTKPSVPPHQIHHSRAGSTSSQDGRTSAMRNRGARHSPSNSCSSTATARKATTPTIAPEHLRREAASIGTLTQPTRKRNFGDGSELEIFDDLPTSSTVESKYRVTAVKPKVASVALQKKTPAQVNAVQEEFPKKKNKVLDLTSCRPEDIPSFARDTNASRKAREITQQRLGLSPSNPSPNAERWRNKIAARNSTVANKSSTRKITQTKPHLIKAGTNNSVTLSKEAKASGMVYNATTCRWEGNSKVLSLFDAPDLKETRPPPRPALITKVNHGTNKMGIQVVGGMVFDPSRMCWLKVDEDPDDEVDPFEGLDDLQEDLMSVDGQSIVGGQTTSNSVVMGAASSYGGNSGSSRLAAGFGEFVVGEEFDVGPEFVKRQMEEEKKWRKETRGWFNEHAGRGDRYALRNLLRERMLLGEGMW